MKRKVIFAAIPVILTVFSAMYLFNMHTSVLVNAETLKKAFASSGAQTDVSECYVWSRMDEGYCRKHGIGKTAEVIAEELGILKDENYSKIQDENDNVCKVNISGYLADGRKASVGVWFDVKSSQELNYSSTVSLSEEGSSAHLKASGRMALNALKGLADKMNLNFSITGNFKGKLADTAVRQLFSKVFTAAAARKVYEMEDRDLISISAYSPLLVNHIDFEGKQTNLNLAVRYNAYGEKTCLWLATPVITTEY